MSDSLYPRKEILQALCDLTESVSKNRFASTRPSATGAQMQDFLLVGLKQRIYTPGDTYQLTTGQISVFARDIQGGLENTCRLEEMQATLTQLFPIRHPKFLATRPILLPGGSDGAGFHALIIQFRIRIHRKFNIHPTDKFKL